MQLIIYDTSNFDDFPIGGQLTSIRNFLTYIADYQPEVVQDILLVGVTNQQNEVGKISPVTIQNNSFNVLHVLYRDANLEHVVKSMRVEYLKALFKFRKQIPNSKDTVHYIHTPEAFLEVNIMHPHAKIAVFSHGSFFSMVQGFRFYKNNKMVDYFFNKFIIHLIKRANIIFALDQTSVDQYTKYNPNIYLVNNSVILPENVQPKDIHTPIRLLFVGRLSEGKRIDKIIDAAKKMAGMVSLTIVGDGELRETLEKHVDEINATEYVKFIGAVEPSDVKQHMEDNDILVMNSAFEGKPMTIIEALSLGMPIVTTLVGGIGEQVVIGKDAEQTDGTCDSIVKAVKRISIVYKKYSSAALQSAKQFDYRVVNKSIFKELTKL